MIVESVKSRWASRQKLQKEAMKAAKHLIQPVIFHVLSEGSLTDPLMWGL